MLKKLIAILFIYCCTVIAWTVLGSTLLIRSSSQDDRLKKAVNRLWGTVQTQRTPQIHYEQTKEVQTHRVEGTKSITEIHTEKTKVFVPLTSSNIGVILSLQNRQKGLFWNGASTQTQSGPVGQ